MTDHHQSTLREYLRVLRANRLVIVVTTLVFAGIAFGLTYPQKPSYVATASVTFQDESLSDAEAGLTNVLTQTAAQLAAQGATTMLGTNVLSRVRKSLHSTMSLAALRAMVVTSVDPNSALVLVTATAHTGLFASRLANAVARIAVRTQTSAERSQFKATAARVLAQYNSQRSLHSPVGSQPTLALQDLLDRVSTLQTLAANATPASIAVPAAVPTSPSAPKPLRSTIFGALIGLLLGIGIAFVRDLLDRRLQDSGAVQEALALPVIGRVRVEAMGNAAYVANGRGPMHDQDVESFRILRANLDFVDIDQPLKSIVVSSPLPEEGKSTVAASLAAANAAAGKRTLLVECDLRRPCLSERLSVEASPGLSDYLAGQATPAEVVQVVTLRQGGQAPNGTSGSEPGSATMDAGDLAVITAGSHSIRPAELLGSQRFRVFLEEITAAYDIVVIDTPPLLAVSDTLEIVPHADVVLLCIRADQTTRDQARAAKNALSHRRDLTVGVVITGLKPGREHDYGDYSYAYYGEH